MMVVFDEYGLGGFKQFYSSTMKGATIFFHPSDVNHLYYTNASVCTGNSSVFPPWSPSKSTAFDTTGSPLVGASP